jgi:hypothetical protein
VHDRPARAGVRVDDALVVVSPLLAEILDREELDRDVRGVLGEREIVDASTGENRTGSAYVGIPIGRNYLVVLGVSEGVHARGEPVLGARFVE